MKIALVGNPNSGKTTIFNALTGADAPIGNWSGVTVRAATASVMHHGISVTLTDLPGICSLSSPTGEELSVCAALQQDKPDVILNVVNSCQLRRHLPLTLQLLELDIPVILVLNFSDDAARLGIRVDAAGLGDALGIPAVLCSGYDKGSLAELLRLALASPKNLPRPPLAAAERYRMAESLTREFLSGSADRAAAHTLRLDSFFCHPVLALPLFVLVMLTVFYFSFGPPGAMLSSCAERLLAYGREAMEALLLRYSVALPLSDLIVNGILGGVGSVLVFLPQLGLLFFFLAVLEAGGYMARIAFITDAAMARLGLSGQSVIPLLLGFGCSVPAIMACRTLPRRRERLLTMLLIPFMSCSARMPVYAFFAEALFDEQAWIIISFCYLLGVLTGLILAILAHRMLPNRRAVPFLLELPLYRVPYWPHVFRSLWGRLREYLEKAGTVIFLSSVLVWLVSHVTPTLDYTDQLTCSLLGLAGQGMSLLFQPLGFGDARLAAALITGLLSKETIVATLAVLSFDPINLTPLSACSFLVFVLQYTPCTAAMAAFRGECGSRTLTVAAAFGYFLFAWIITFFFYRLGLLVI